MTIKDFKLSRRGNRSFVSFRLDRSLRNGRRSQGRLLIVASDLARDQHASYPDHELTDAQPPAPRDGEWYSVRRFKIVRAEFAVDESFEPKVYRVYVYDTDDRLVLTHELRR